MESFSVTATGDTILDVPEGASYDGIRGPITLLLVEGKLPQIYQPPQEEI